MKVQEIMTENPACYGTETSLQEVARMMANENVGSIPVTDEAEKPIGVVTDRDITIRAVAEGKNPLDLTAGDVMTEEVFTVTPEISAEECFNLMEEKQVRRVPVVDENGAICGIVAQADVAKYGSTKQAAEVVKEVSKGA